MSRPAASALEAVLKRDRLIVIGGLISVVALAWVYILTGAGMGMSAFQMTAQTTTMPAAPETGAMAMMTPMAWSAGTAVLMFFMWWIMMVAMMLPSATPMILLFAAVNRKQAERGNPAAPTGLFALGYIVVWGLFSLIATGLQWALESAQLLSAMMASTSVALGAGLLIAAGLWQLTPLKQACLKHCRSPIEFLANHYRKGRWGAFRMGLGHGAFCLGCCWFLMALLFYGGVMNLYWIVGLALYVLLEKIIPIGHRLLGQAAGLALIAWGGWLLVGLL